MRVSSSSSRLRRTQTLREVACRQVEPAVPPSLRIEPEFFQLTASGCAGLRQTLCSTGVTGWQPSDLRPSAHLPARPACRAPGLRRDTDPSALHVAANSSSRPCSTLHHRPAGNLQFALKTHLPARPVRDLPLRPDFCRRLAPPVSIRVPHSFPLRNCASNQPSGSRRRLFHWPCQRFNFRLAPLVAHSGQTGGCISGLHRSSHLPAHPAIHVRIPAGSSVEETLRPFHLWIQVNKVQKSVDFTAGGASGGLFARVVPDPSSSPSEITNNGGTPESARPYTHAARSARRAPLTLTWRPGPRACRSALPGAGRKPRWPRAGRTPRR